MKKLKAYFVQPALDKTDDVFEKAQINLTFDLTFAFMILYVMMLGHNLSIKTSFAFDAVNYFSLLGIVGCLPILRLTKSYKKAAFTFWLTGFIVSTSMIFLAKGESDLQFGVWHSFSIVIAFSLVGRTVGLLNAVYLIVMTILIVLNSLNGWEMFDIGLDRGIEVEQDPVPVAIPMIAVTYIMFQTLRTRNKAQAVMAEQKDLETEHRIELERKNLEITDSITYAKRIQSALLPNNSKWQKNLPNSFVVYLPKDIVAGDFYWMEKVGDTILFAAADCTGHGVPGAMVSVVCYNALNRSVREFGLTDPGEILDKTRELVMAEFAESEEGVKDGMDIALCSIELDTDHSRSAQLKYAGAHNHLWLLKKGDSEIQEFKADKQPIGNFYNPQPFNTHQVFLEEGDQVFIFSDGFADQFGGEKGKKYKAKRFKQFLSRIGDKKVQEQKATLIKEFEDWKGEIEQLDDVCIIGVKV